jgi:predicted GTPase
LRKAKERLSIEGTLRITLLGAYSAGKSSLVASLTGADVGIDADVATQEITHYPWRGLELVDTPGVQADVEDTEHDRLAHQAVVDADLVLFVVSNELFTPRLAQHLHHLISPDGLAMADKTAIVVNKIDRETNTDEVIISEVSRAIGEDLNLPIWLCAARKALQAKDAPEKIRGRFIRQSRMTALVEHIDEFVRDAGTTGRLLTPIQVVEDVLDQAESALVDEKERKDELELIRRKQRILTKLENRFHEIREQTKKQVRTTVQQAAQGVVDEIEAFTSREDVEQLFRSGMEAAEADLDHILSRLSGMLREAFQEATNDLTEVSASDLAERVSRLEAKRGDKVTIQVEGEAPSMNPHVAIVARNGIKPLGDALDLAAKNPKQMRDFVYNAGKKLFKHKFRPWEAAKAGKNVAKWAGRASKALPFLAFALDAYVNHREEKAEEERERHLAQMRIGLRRAFNEQANVEAKAVDAAVDELMENWVHDISEQLSEAATRITDAHSARNEASKAIGQLKARLRELRRGLRWQNEVDPSRTAA